MKNSETPAMPLTQNLLDDLTYVCVTESLGLTKREHFAGLALQGWLARCANAPHTAELNPDSIAEVAVSFADALLKQLEREFEDRE